MPKLDNVATERLNLPSSTSDDPAWVDVKTTLLLNDLVAVTDANSDTERAITLLSSLITAWNFTDKDGVAVEPTSENIGKLRVEDFTYLSDYVGKHMSDVTRGLDNAEKKASSSASTAETLTTSPPTI